MNLVLTLKDYFTQYNLTDGQNLLVEELDKFLLDNSPCFLLKGYAGTGKTFMMKGLTDYLTEIKKCFRIAAPTGRAAKVISQKTKQKTSTIHKLIYSNKDLKEFKVRDEDGTETFKFEYELRNNEDPNGTIYIIDEASMLSDIYSETEFFRFGSGSLLKDLIKYVNFSSLNNGKKVIFIGDDAQLPPVNMNFSPALDRNYLNENYSLISSEFELTEIVRQKVDSGILHNATKLRKALKNNVFNQVDINTGFEDIIGIKYDELLSKYLSACNNSLDHQTIIIAYSNSSVKEYNDFVRSYFFPNQTTIAIGDRIILVGNNYNYPQMELLNGDFGTIKDVAALNEIRTISLKRKDKKSEIVEVKVPLIFRNVTATFMDNDFKSHNIECKIIENLVHSQHRDLSTDETNALYIDFKIRNPKLKPGTKEFKEAIRSDVYFNALRVKFGYAVTCHKAQGGEWLNTFLDCKTSMGYFNSSYFRWLYTGVTRAKDNLFTIGEPHFGISSNLRPPKIENIQLSDDVLIINKDLLETELPFDFSTHIAFLKYIYLAIWECLKDEKIHVFDIRHTNYLEHYTFSQGNRNAVFKIFYNSKNKITAIQKPEDSTDFIENIYKRLVYLIDKKIVIEEKMDESKFEFDHLFQKDFYESLKLKLTPFNFQISKIEHKQYHEIYEIMKNGLTVSYKFWYDGKFKFKKTEIIPSRTTGLVDEINKILLEEGF